MVLREIEVWAFYGPSSAPVCALGHLPLKGKAFGRLIAAPTNKGERSQNRAGGPGVPPLRVERFSHSGRPQGSPLRRFSAAIQNGASRRPRPTKGESLQSGRVRTPAPTADAEASCPFVGAGHWPARRSRTSKHLLGKARRRCRTTPAAIFATPGPSGPGGIAEVTQILRAGNSPETVKYASPVMGSGERRL